jgi:hypothetical protein
LAEVESLLGGVSRRVVFGFTSGVGRSSSHAVSDLTLYIHIMLTTTRPGGRSTSSHVPLSMKEEYSFSIAACH